MSAQSLLENDIRTAKKLGLKTEEIKEISRRLDRSLTLTEWGIFSSLWSEHCSYKSSKKWLAQLPTTGVCVICGPGENAGVVDIGDGLALVFKIESHNHPSFIEPYHGAATGVGGIMRDVFTMGARPIALLNALRFGDSHLPRTRYLLSRVVQGIGDYGNCVGIPTIGGEIGFDSSYNGNILVNAMCIGLVEKDHIFYAKASGIGNTLFYVGAKTGRDGVCGASMASSAFEGNAQDQRPTVQVGDPFTQKILMEACLELMQEKAIVAIQDMGAAGLTSASVEMAQRGGVGLFLDLDKVPVRMPLSAYEMMLSESQERMLLVVQAGCEEKVKTILDKWDINSCPIGHIIEEKVLIVQHQGRQEAHIPLATLEAPLLDLPFQKTQEATLFTHDFLPEKMPLFEALKVLMGSEHLCSRQWVFEQYDSTVMADTLSGPSSPLNSDAGVVRIHGTRKALVASVDCTPRYCFADPHKGAQQAIAECWRNIITTGARPLALTNCLNFGSPEKPEIMGQFIATLEGMAESCRKLDFPIVSGNVSLYNATGSTSIKPTPVIGGVGLIDDITYYEKKQKPIPGDFLILLGETKGHMTQSLYGQLIDTSYQEGPPPTVDLDAEKKIGLFVQHAVVRNIFKAVHDVSDGGVLVSLAELALECGMGFELKPETDLPIHIWAYGEDQARYVAIASAEHLERLHHLNPDFPLQVVGTLGGETIIFLNQILPLSLLKEIWQSWFDKYMAQER